MAAHTIVFEAYISLKLFNNVIDELKTIHEYEALHSLFHSIRAFLLNL